MKVVQANTGWQRSSSTTQATRILLLAVCRIVSTPCTIVDYLKDLKRTLSRNSSKKRAFDPKAADI
jgi:hypothetical protein